MITPDANRLLRMEDAGALIEALSTSTASPAPLLFEGVDLPRLRRRLDGVRVNRAALLLESKWASMDLGQSFVGPEHVLLGLAQQEDVRSVMEAWGFNLCNTRIRLAAIVGSIKPDVRASLLRTAWTRTRRWGMAISRRN